MKPLKELLAPRNDHRRLFSAVVGAVVITATAIVAFPLAGISAVGPLLVAVVAYAAGTSAARWVRPATKDDLLVWFMLLGVTIVLICGFLSTGIVPPDAAGGVARDPLAR